MTTVFGLVEMFAFMKSPEGQLWQACTDGDLEKVQNLIHGHPEMDLNCHDPELGRTPFYRACGHYRDKVVAFLLTLPQLDPNQVQSEGATPFYIACQCDSLGVVKLLLADPRVDIIKGRRIAGSFTPLMIACEKGFLEIASLLMKLPDQMDRVDDLGRTPFFYACAHGRDDLVKVFLDTFPKSDWMNMADSSGFTPLTEAIKNAKYRVIELLMDDERIDHSNEHNRGIKGLHIYALGKWHGDISIQYTLLAYSSSHDEFGKQGGAALIEDFSQGGESLLAQLDRVRLNEFATKYEADSLGTWSRWRDEFGLWERDLPRWFALIVLFCDGYVRFAVGEDHKLARFLTIASKLPIELQMILCHRASNSSKDVIGSKELEPALKRFVRCFFAQ